MINLLKLLIREPFLIKKQSPIHGTGIFTTRDIREGKDFYYTEMLLRKPCTLIHK